MTKPYQNLEPAHFRIASFATRIMVASEDFGGRYQYSPRLMLLGAIFTAAEFSKSALARRARGPSFKSFSSIILAGKSRVLSQFA
jgi:hypothetical protein